MVSRFASSIELKGRHSACHAGRGTDHVAPSMRERRSNEFKHLAARVSPTVANGRRSMGSVPTNALGSLLASVRLRRCQARLTEADRACCPLLSNGAIIAATNPPKRVVGLRSSFRTDIRFAKKKKLKSENTFDLTKLKRKRAPVPI